MALVRPLRGSLALMILGALFASACGGGGQSVRGAVTAAAPTAQTAPLPATTTPTSANVAALAVTLSAEPEESTLPSVAAFTSPYQLAGGTGRINNLAYSPLGDWIAAASADGSVTLWQPREGSTPRLLQGHEGQVWSVAFSPDGERLASGGEDGTIRIWQVGNGTLVAEIDSLLDRIYRLEYAPDGTTLAVGGSLCAVEVRDARLGILMQTLTQPNCVSRDGWPTSWGIAFSPDSSTLVAGEGRACCGSTVQQYALTGGIYGSPVRLRGYGTAIQDLAFTPDGSIVAVASTSAVIELWGTEEQSLLRELEGHAYRVYDIDISRDGRWLASASRDASVRVWQVQDGELLQTLETQMGPATAVAFSSDGKQLVCGTEDGIVIVWQLGG